MEKKQSKLYSAMKSYGVDNFIIEQIDTAGSLKELNSKEKFWIKTFDSTNPDIGYNIADGGNGGKTWSPKGRITVNNGVKNLQIPKEELEIYLEAGWVKGGHKLPKRPNTGKWVNNGVTQKRIQESELQSYLNNGWVLGYTDKGKENLSKSHLGKSPSNKGKHCSEEQKKKTSVATKLAMNTPEMREKMKLVNEAKKGSKWMTKGDCSKLVKKEDVQIYLNNGYRFGRK